MSVDGDDRIRIPHMASSAAPRVDTPAENPGDGFVMRGMARDSRHRATGILFGSYVGLLMGPVAAGISCWLAAWYEWRWQAIALGLALGPVGGMVVGACARRTQSIALARREIATLICVGYCLIPAVLVVVECAGIVSTRFSGMLCIGSVFAAPMLGMLIGAVLDRSYESLLRRAWRAGLMQCAAGTTICVALVGATVFGPDCPGPDALAREVRVAVEWLLNPVGDPNQGLQGH
jgi:MFS family permease